MNPLALPGPTDRKELQLIWGQLQLIWRCFFWEGCEIKIGSISKYLESRASKKKLAERSNAMVRNLPTIYIRAANIKGPGLGIKATMGFLAT